jgi:putative ABC transport system permease protein
MLESVRDAVRGFRRRRAVAVTIVLTLTLGIGANSAIFSMVDAVLLRPLPYPAPERLVSVYELNRGLKQATQLVAPVRLEEWNRADRSFAGLAGSYFENMTDTTGALPERVEAMRISPRFFTVLGVSAAIGRTLTPQEEVFGGPRAIVLSDAFWRKRFNGDPTAVGRQMVLTGVSHTIVGVMPPTFKYPTATTEIWTPAQFGGGMMRERRARLYLTVGRLSPGVTLEQAETDLTAVQTRLGEQFPDTDKGWGASLVPLKEEKVGDVRRSLWFLFAAVALVLLAACGNVACLMLADATRREHEVAVRFALGASRTTVIRQLLTEGFVLAMIGAALGLVSARWGIDVLRRTAMRLPQVDAIHVDGRLALFTIVVGAVTTVLFALAPALEVTKADPAAALSRGGRGHVAARHLAQRALVATQVALAIILLTGAGLLIRSFARLQEVSPGFDPANVLTFRMSASWAEAATAVVGRQARTVARLEAIPGVEAAAISQTMPAGVTFPPGEFAIVGRDGTQKLFSHGRMVSAGYFRTLHIPILQGATCSADPAAPLSSKALVTRAFADQYFAGTSPTGHMLTAPWLPSGQEVEILGIVGDVRESGLAHAAEPLIYWCGYSPFWPDPHFIVRTDPSRPVSIAAIRAALLEIEPKRALYSVRSLSETLSESVAQQRLTTVLLALFAATALLLAGMGLYGVLSQLVAARRREIGVRMALGARAAQIVASVVGQAATVTGVGIVVGLAGALVLVRFMTTLVFGIATRDPLTFSIVPLVLAAVAAVAALVPSRRAATTDPMEALRQE